MAVALKLPMSMPIRAHNAGLFISRGEGRHGDRMIDSHELIFVRQGRLGMYEDRTRFDVQAGQTLLLLPGISHGGTADYPADLSFYWIHFDASGAGSLPLGSGRARAGRRLRQTHGPESAAHARSDHLVIPRHGTVSRPDRLAELFHWFLNDQEAGRLLPAAADLLLMLMLNEVADRRGFDLPEDGAGTTLAAQAERLIRTRFHEALQTSALARELDCNPDYLGRVYHRAYGCTLTEAVHRARLKQARALLLESAMNIGQVARAVGYDDAGYFRRTFLRQEGISPRAYRQLHARMHINTK